MKPQHKFADILRAIADGKKVQWSNLSLSKIEWYDYSVTDESATFYLMTAASHLKWRIKPEKIVQWFNIYSVNDSFDAYGYSTKELADKNANGYRIACIRVEFEKGEGL